MPSYLNTTGIQMPQLNNKIKKYLSVLIGALLLSLGVTLFLVPNQIVSGGTPGISILLNHFTGVQLGLLMFCINAPLVLISIKSISRGFALRTIFSICVSSLAIDFLQEFLRIEGFVVSPILASIFGGVFVGLGLGFIIEGKASAGGPSIIARILAGKTGWKQENIMMILDAIIVLLAGLIFQNIESALWSLVSVYASARAIDVVLSGRSIYKLVHVSTRNPIVVREQILAKLELQGTIVDGTELSGQEDKKLLIFVIENSKITKLKNIVKKYDQDGFIVLSDASELSGRGH